MASLGGTQRYRGDDEPFIGALVVTPLRVAVDASAGVSGGSKRYLEEMLPRLAAFPDLTVGPVLGRSGHLPAYPDAPIVIGDRMSGRSRHWRKALKTHGVDVVLAPTEISFARYDVPLVLAARNAMILDKSILQRLPPRQRRKSRLQRVLTYASCRSASAHIAVSNYAADQLVIGFGVPRHAVRVIYHGGARATAPPRPARRVSRLLFVSSLHRYKGLHVLLRALAQVAAEWSLDVAGDRIDPDYGRELDALVVSLGMQERIRFHGYTVGSDLDRLYHASDLLVWPSVAETFGHPLIEAHAAGLPIIAADACSNREVAGDAAHYFAPGDTLALTELLRTATEQGLSVGALPRCYDWSYTAEQTAALLRDVVQNARDASR